MLPAFLSIAFRCMDLDDYQTLSRSTAVYTESTRSKNEQIYYCTLGLAGETGEVAEKIKKVLRDQGGLGFLDPTVVDAIVSEMGDVLWYLAALATELQVSLAEVALANLQKLESRKARQALHGSGDNR